MIVQTIQRGWKGLEEAVIQNIVFHHELHREFKIFGRISKSPGFHSFASTRKFSSIFFNNPCRPACETQRSRWYFLLWRLSLHKVSHCVSNPMMPWISPQWLTSDNRHLTLCLQTPHKRQRIFVRLGLVDKGVY